MGDEVVGIGVGLEVVGTGEGICVGVTVGCEETGICVGRSVGLGVGCGVRQIHGWL